MIRTTLFEIVLRHTSNNSLNAALLCGNAEASCSQPVSCRTFCLPIATTARHRHYTAKTRPAPLSYRYMGSWSAIYIVLPAGSAILGNPRVSESLVNPITERSLEIGRYTCPEFREWILGSERRHLDSIPATHFTGPLPRCVTPCVLLCL